MKKNFLPVVVFITVVSSIILQGCCSKKDDAGKPITEFRLGLAKLNIADQKEIFYYLPANVKSSLWVDRIDEVLQMKLTDSQKELLQDMQQHLQPVVFDTTMATIEQRKTFATYLNEWKTNTQKAFANADSTKLSELMAGLGKPNNAQSIMQGAPAVPDCDCNSATSACICLRKPAAKCHMVNTGFPWYTWYDGLCQ